MTQPNLNELIARAMGEEKTYTERSDGVLIGRWPDFRNDANHAVRAWEWLAPKLQGHEYIAFSPSHGLWVVEIGVIGAGNKLTIHKLTGTFCAAVCAAFAWWIGQREESK